MGLPGISRPGDADRRETGSRREADRHQARVSISTDYFQYATRNKLRRRKDS